MDYFDAERALAEMLTNNVLFANSRKYIEENWGGKPTEEGPTVVLFVICNDLFYWASADAECLPLDEVQSLYEAWKKDSRWGVDKWCCRRRKMKPQIPVQELMKAEGAWEDWMDKLEDPVPS